MNKTNTTTPMIAQWCALTLLLLSGFVLPGCFDEEGESEAVATAPVEHKTGSNVVCEKDDDCSPGEYCDPSISVCRKGCNEDSDCKKGTRCNVEDNVCVTCLEDSDCPFGVCHPLYKACVSCMEDDDCQSGACIEELFSCVQCEEDSDCEEGVCVESLNMCRQCASDVHCDDGDPCSQDYCKDNVCTHPPITNTIGCFGVECLSDDDCSNSEEAGCANCEMGICQVITGVQACETDEDCLGELPNACFEAECKQQACGGSSCLFSLSPECDACKTDADCPVGPQDCSNACSNGVCTPVSLGDTACECVTASDCGVSNGCQNYGCNDNQCVLTLTEDGDTCDDDNPCTLGEACKSGVCMGGKSLADCGVSCSSAEDCGLNLLGCSGECIEGSCLYPPLAGSCPECNSQEDCDDNNPCTEEKCIQGNCFSQGEGNTFACDDEDPCTVQDQCEGGTCAGIPLPGCPGECTVADDCATPELDVCSISCIDFACVYEDFPLECPDKCSPPEPCHEVACEASDCGEQCIYVKIPECKPCNADSDCDDKNDCTKTYCEKASKSCKSVKLSNVPCDSGNPCTTGTCNSGSCISLSPGTSEDSVCDDGNPCTNDVCEDTGCVNTPATGASCDDQDPCTVMDQCNEDAVCASLTGNPLLDPYCGEPKSVCQATWACDTKDDCPEAHVCQCIPSCPNCDDCVVSACIPLLPQTGNPTFDTSETQGEEEEAQKKSIDYSICDGSPQECLESPTCNCLPSCPECNDCMAFICWKGDICSPCAVNSDCDECEECSSDGTCVESSDCVKCGKDADCEGPCGLCDKGKCTVKPGCTTCKNDTECASPCSICSGGQCVEKEGCTTCETNEECPDPCETCLSGQCQEKADCQECKIDSDCGSVCSACVEEQCQPKADCIPCSSDEECPAESCGGCVDGQCLQESPVTCSDLVCPQTDDPCEIYLCVEDGCQAQCVKTPVEGCLPCVNDEDCKGDNPCTQFTCDKKVCVSTGVTDCDDGKDCTLDSCDPSIGCVYDINALNGTECDDGSLCTLSSTCLLGECSQTKEILACEDGNPCTIGNCDPLEGCFFINTEQGVPCEDGNPCTENDQCLEGQCVNGNGKICASENICEISVCNPENGLCESFPEEGTACETEDPCNPAGTCEDFVCVSPPPVDSEIDQCKVDESDSCPNGGVCTLVDCVYTCIQVNPVPLCCSDADGELFVTASSCTEKEVGSVQVSASQCQESQTCCVNKNGTAIYGSLFSCFDLGGTPSETNLCISGPSD